MIQQRFLFSLALPFFAWCGFSQFPGFASSSHNPIVRDAESPSRLLQDHVGIQQHKSQITHPNFLISLSAEQGNVKPFQPDCQENDNLCLMWSEFRAPYPYPTQRIAAKAITEDEIVLIISEPPSNFSKLQWQEIIESIFSDDLLEYQTFAWMIGVDGWVEDIVLRLKKPDAPQNNLLSDRVTRDRIALLNIAMFGSSFGTKLESMDSTQFDDNIAKLPNLRLSAKEVLDWVTDQEIGWQALNIPSYDVNHWLNQASIGTTQVMTSTDQTLVLLTFPLSDISTARRTGILSEQLKIAFREFAVSSDVLLGGAWSDNQVAILARARQVPMQDFPPLRVETFELIAAQKASELHQSYERNNLMAGKLSTGEYTLRDWAPVYLSPALINTEFGALLNITDQILKSWSEAGQIEYIYFDYPHKPNSFPFSGTPISEVVFKQTGSQQVLFNWNTTGMGSIVSGNPSVLIPTQTGAVPVTYGSELEQGGEIETGHLQRYEEEAYDYFANLQDPNLAIVAQYTLLYQLMLAAVPVETEILPPQPTTGAQTLTNYALNFIRELDEATGGDLVNARELISAFRKENPDVDNQQLAALLADPRMSQTQFLTSVNQEIDSLSNLENTLKERLDEYNKLVAEFETEQESFNDAVRQFNAEVDRVNRQGGASSSEKIQLDQQSASLDADRQDLEELSSDLDRRKEEIERLEQRLVSLSETIGQSATESNTLFSEVQQLVSRLKEFIDPDDLDPVRVSFSNAHSASPNDWIKTPASVLSWRNEGGRVSLTNVGGHNLNSQALRFESSSGVDTLRVIETGSGRVLQYNPRFENDILTNTDAITRAVEHRDVTEPQSLLKIVQNSPETRTRLDALEIDDVSLLPPSDDVSRTTELQTFAEINECCDFVSGNILTTKNPSPPPPVKITSFGGTPEFYMALAARSRPPVSNRPIVILDGSVRADAITRSLSEIIRQQNSGSRGIGLFTALANIINLPTRTVSANSITVMGYGRNNNLSPLRINLGAEGSSRSFINQAIARLSAVFRPRTAVIQEVTTPAIELQFPSSWQDAAAQNKLAIIKFSYSELDQPNVLTDVYMTSVANDPSQVTTVRTEMVNATNAIIASKNGEEAIVVDTLVEIREQIEEQIKSISDERVEMLLEREQDTYYITDQNRRNIDS